MTDGEELFKSGQFGTFYPEDLQRIMWWFLSLYVGNFSKSLGGGVPAIRDIIYVFLWHESEVQGLSAHCNKKVGKHFLMVGSRLAVKWSCTGPRWCKAKDFFVFCAGTICLVCFHGFFVLLFYMSSVSVTQNKCPNSITAILSTYLIHEFLVNVKCRMDGSHRKPLSACRLISWYNILPMEHVY